MLRSQSDCKRISSVKNLVRCYYKTDFLLHMHPGQSRPHRPDMLRLKKNLAVVFSCERFHQCIYGKTVEVHSDYKPLENIFQESLGDGPTRLQRMPLQLQKHNINHAYKRGKLLQVAGSRLIKSAFS